SDTVRMKVEDRFVLRPVDLVAPVGTQQPVMIWELLAERREGFPDLPAIERRAEDWVHAYEFYARREWAAAAEAFRSYEATHGPDTVAHLYIERCEGFAVAPPSTDWNGVQAFDHK
ncbi:MAG TPA: hypothetical protein VH722_08635, partial [Alphaproteobacteria bacterium]|nr:hypothetical protein [Alphaproteobacteria bacterium]